MELRKTEVIKHLIKEGNLYRLAIVCARSAIQLLYVHCRLAKDTSFVVPDGILAASFWIVSTSFFSNWVQLSHIISPDSSSGLINAI